MNKKAIFAMGVAILVTACIVMSAAGIAARPSADQKAKDDAPADVAAALSARLETEIGADIDEAVLTKMLQKMAASRKDRALDVTDVEEMTLINHGDELSLDAWDDGMLVCPYHVNGHYFPQGMVPDTYAYGGLLWDGANNDLDLQMCTAVGSDVSWWGILTESTGPVPLYNDWGFNSGVFLMVTHYGPSCGTALPTPQYYVVAVDSHCCCLGDC